MRVAVVGKRLLDAKLVVLFGVVMVVVVDVGALDVVGGCVVIFVVVESVVAFVVVVGVVVFVVVVGVVVFVVVGGVAIFVVVGESVGASE